MLISAADVLDRAPCALGVTLGPQHVVELLNPAGRRLLGAGVVLGRPIHEVLPEFGRILVDLLDRAFQHGPSRDDAAVLVVRAVG